MTAPSNPLPASLRQVSYTDKDESVDRPRQSVRSPSASLATLPFRANPSISSLYASTTSTSPSIQSGASTPSAEKSQIEYSSYGGSDVRAGSISGGSDSAEVRNVIQRAFAPHVGVLASADTETLLRGRGFEDGFLQLIRPYGELVSGRVIVRDSIGVNRTWDDFGIRFVGLKDGLSTPRLPGSSRPSFESKDSGRNIRSGINRSKRSTEVARVGGEAKHVEEVVERHLNFAELRPTEDVGILSPSENDQTSGFGRIDTSVPPVSPFYTLYLRRLLSGLPITPHETFSHPVACVIVTSSRNASPIEEFKRLYNSSSTGNDRLPQWVNNDFLRYYVLVHDEDNDDISKSVSLYEQMKRHFGLHCHLLRLRSTQCLPTDDESIRLPVCEWMTAAEELAAIQTRELADEEDDPTPCLFESDATAIKTFVRELVTQSIVPGMERLCAQWNEQIATRRKGISGRLLSVGKRWGFGLGRNSNTQVSVAGSSNYDSLQGYYRPDTPEALMRKLADYAFMLRDFKLAQNTFDVLRSDFEHDKAWKYYAGANEMYLISTMLNVGNPINKRLESIQRWLEGAVHSYVHRCDAPFYALRTLLLAFEAAKARQSLPLDETAQWAARILDMNLIGPIGTALVMERIASCFAQKWGAGALHTGSRRRKHAFWKLLAADAWTKIHKTVQAEKSLAGSLVSYNIVNVNEMPEGLAWMQHLLLNLQQTIISSRLQASGVDLLGDAMSETQQAPVVEEVMENFGSRTHRRGNSLLPDLQASNDPIPPLSPIRTRENDLLSEEGFEQS